MRLLLPTLLVITLSYGATPTLAQEPDAADAAWRAGDTETAERLYAEILAADSTHYAALHRTALLRAWAERYEESLLLFDRMLRLYPDAVDARIDRARVLAWQGQVDQAIADLDEILAADPANTAAIAALAQFQSWAGRYDEALTAYSRLERLDPAVRDAPYDRARVLAWAERYEAAAAVYDSILAVRPGDADALAGRARILLWQGDLKRGERLWRTLLAREPHQMEALIGLSRALRWQGRDAAAHAVARRALAVDPTSADARAELRAVEQAFRPFAQPGLAYESDTDGNRIGTAAAMARFRPVPAIALRVDAYERRAEERSAAALRQAGRGLTLAASTQLGVGWTVSAMVGASAGDGGIDIEPAWGAAVTTPGRERVRASANVRRQAFDATARMIERGVVMTELNADVSTRLGTRTDLSAAAGTAWLEGRVSGESNRRWSGYLSASRHLVGPLTLAATGRAFGYRHDLNDGYFDPDFFGLAELLARVTQPVGPVGVTLEAAPGFQQVRSDGDPRPVVRAAAALTWRIGTGRELSLGGVFANAGLDRLSETEGADYAYHALTARFGWTF